MALTSKADPGELVVTVLEEEGRRALTEADALDVRSRRASQLGSTR